VSITQGERWRDGGTAGTTSSLHFRGSGDRQPFQGSRAARLLPIPRLRPTLCQDRSHALHGADLARADPAGVGAAVLTPIVGRATVIAALRTVVDDVIGGSAAVVLLCGEPGIGKSRLAREAVDFADTRGAVAAWSTCWDADGAPPFWPWQQALRALGVRP